ncbi:hypothetical protein CEXT_720981 [Caerostris extrusa]|uniref:Uncharacterized protein n=1 Tax=Caerostris extrusa TaxID=172846 RepID=A0AAV4M7M8_CAEEX|nr:hypothetical protein CEXT_720981 [Caerostris extrusa]
MHYCQPQRPSFLCLPPPLTGEEAKMEYWHFLPPRYSSFLKEEIHRSLWKREIFSPSHQFVLSGMGASKTAVLPSHSNDNPSWKKKERLSTVVRIVFFCSLKRIFFYCNK